PFSFSPRPSQWMAFRAAFSVARTNSNSSTRSRSYGVCSGGRVGWVIVAPVCMVGFGLPGRSLGLPLVQVALGLGGARRLLVLDRGREAQGRDAGDAAPRRGVAVQVEPAQPAQVSAVGQRPRPLVGDASVAQVERLQPPQDAAADDLLAALVAQARAA